MSDLGHEFGRALRGLYDRAKTDCNVSLPGLLQLIEKHGGGGTARELLEPGQSRLGRQSSRSGRSCVGHSGSSCTKPPGLHYAGRALPARHAVEPTP